MNTFARSAAAVSLILTLSAGAASAATITADYSHGNGKSINITNSSVGSINNVYAGNFVLDPVKGGDIVSYCVDLAHKIADGVRYDVKSLSQSGFTATVQNRISSLFSTFYATLGTSNHLNAAFQVALWEIIDEKPGNTLDVSRGQFRVEDSRVRTRAQKMLDGMGPDSDNWDLTFYDAKGNQDQLGATPPVGAVPLPAGLPLLLTALGGFAVVRRSRKKS